MTSIHTSGSMAHLSLHWHKQGGAGEQSHSASVGDDLVDDLHQGLHCRLIVPELTELLEKKRLSIKYLFLIIRNEKITLLLASH